MSAQLFLWIVLTTSVAATTVVVMSNATNTTALLSNRVSDARAAMAALIESRALPYTENESAFPTVLAELAWRIADAMGIERDRRSGRQTIPPPRGAR